MFELLSNVKQAYVYVFCNIYRKKRIKNENIGSTNNKIHKKNFVETKSIKNMNMYMYNAIFKGIGDSYFAKSKTLKIQKSTKTLQNNPKI